MRARDRTKKMWIEKRKTIERGWTEKEEEDFYALSVKKKRKRRRRGGVDGSLEKIFEEKRSTQQYPQVRNKMCVHSTKHWEK